MLSALRIVVPVAGVVSTFVLSDQQRGEVQLDLDVMRELVRDRDWPATSRACAGG